MDEATPNADEVLIAYLMQDGTNRIAAFLKKLKAKLGDDEAGLVIKLLQEE